ncbi:uncharacterized protein LOC116841583 isoform X2 [Odontomachus brunneus]|nr:uncharacterized protein LOC116841583 isoform X2 [Odontomachus brunneus]XP_032665568.1 uncharacterized protein LOC116841583 isoform X2 [Odontomachus brunneus]
MMYEEILEDAQQVKRTLMVLGENVDLNAICELLQNSGPDYKLEDIINMITENWSSDRQNNLDEAGTPIVDLSSITDKSVIYDDPTIENIQEEYAEISDASSDYDDRDDYYASTNWDDISVVDTVTRSIPSPLEACDIASSSSNHNSEVTVIPPDVDVLEENNNDPNNNLGFLFQEFPDISSDIDHERRDTNVKSCAEIVEKPESPKPGCSKDSHDTFIPLKYSRLHTEAEQINVLLPRLRRNIIYKTLWHNCNAKNRIELTLWDLLPERRPKPQIPSKRKLLDDMCSMEHKKNIADMAISDDAKITHSYSEKPHSVCKKYPHVKKHISDEIIIEDNTIIDTSQQNVDSTTKVKLYKTDKSGNDVNTCNISDKEKSASSEVDTKTEELQITVENPIIPHKAGAGETVRHNHSTTILRPSKLTLGPNNKYMTLKSSSVPTSILSPPKFKIVKNYKQVPPAIVPTRNSGKSAMLKQNTEEHATLATSANGKNTQTSDVNTTQSLINLTENNTIISQDKTVLIVKTETKLSEDNTSHTQSCSTKNVHTLSTVQDTNSSKSEVKNLKQEGNDINTSQVMPSTSEEVNMNITKQLKALKPLQPSNNKQDQALLNHRIFYCAANYVAAANNQTAIHEKASTSKFVADNVQQETDAMKKKQKSTENNSDKKIILSQQALKIYYKLLPMFPCVDTKFIKQLCQDYVADDDLLAGETVILQNLIEYLLNHSQEHPNIKKPEPLLPDSFDLNEQYVNLLEIFPKADPTYLRDVAEQMYDKPDMIKQFVQSKLENPDYPTREQYLAKKKITEQQKQYTTGFQVSQFLEIFPNPFLHFEDNKRECQFDIHAVDFLKHHFNKIRVNTLLSTYAECKYNLSLTAKTLGKLNADMKTKRIYPLIQTEKIPLLQECAFIIHKADLQVYLDNLKENEEREFRELKARNELLECQCCFDNECMPSKCSTCNDGHIFCNSCIIKCTDVKLAEGETHINCLIDCGNEFNLSILQRVLLPTKFSILLQKRQEAEVMAAGLEGLVSCPFCHFASIPPQEDKVFKCFNPDCMKESCRLCKEINHLPLKCNEIKSDAARLYLEEKMTEALIRKCYRCGRTFFKEEGCNKMTCPCGAQMCYICDKPISNYGHFRGQGTMASNLCPLWSDDRRMNAEAVIHVCNETMKQIKEKNPEIEINANALLPKLPPKTKGPHDDVAHANILPAHANRVARHIP